MQNPGAWGGVYCPANLSFSYRGRVSFDLPGPPDTTSLCRLLHLQVRGRKWEFPWTVSLACGRSLRSLPLLAVASSRAPLCAYTA